MKFGYENQNRNPGIHIIKFLPTRNTLEHRKYPGTILRQRHHIERNSQENIAYIVHVGTVKPTQNAQHTFIFTQHTNTKKQTTGCSKGHFLFNSW